MPKQSKPRSTRVTPKPKPRPLRGSPEQTRERLVHVAAEIFNRDGYDGTDSNRIAREAGYAPGTFYKHFADKREIFAAVYAEWVAKEWREVTATLASPGSTRVRAERIVDTFLAHHQRWRGFRASLRALVCSDATVRDFYQRQRHLQLELLEARAGTEKPRDAERAADALLLYTLERSADAFAEEEHRVLEVDPDALRALLVGLVEARLNASRAG